MSANSVSAFLEAFFGQGNELRWNVVRPGATGPAADGIAPFLREAKEDWERLILPRKTANGLTWYAIAQDARSARILRDELIAFVGPSYSDFCGQHAVLEASDAIDCAVMDLSHGNAFKFSVVDSRLKDACRKALIRLLDARSRKPLGFRTAPRPTGRVLRDFELAVQSRARAEAAGYLEELRLLGGFSARNLAFLEAYLNEAFENWEALYAMLDNGALVQAHRPARVTRALIRAVYRRHLADFELTGDAGAALACFAGVIQPRYGRLFLSQAALDGPEVVKSFLLAAANAQPVRIDRRDALVECYPMSAPDRPYVEALGRLVRVPTTAGPAEASLDSARGAFAHGDLDQALSILLELEPSPQSLDLLVRCALEIGSIEASTAAIAVVEAATAAVREAVEQKPRVQRALQELYRQFAGFDSETANSPVPAALLIPQSWLAWLERLSTDSAWTGGLAVAQQGALEWSVEEAAHRPLELAAFAERLRSDLPASCHDALLNALPHLIEFFVRRTESLRVFVPVQEALLDRLLYLEGRSVEAIRAAGLLLESLMRAGMDPCGCHRAVLDVQTAWLEQASLELLDWALDLLDSLVTLQVAPVEAILGFAMTLRGQFLRWCDRVSAGQLALFQQLCREGGVPFDLAEFRRSQEASPDEEAGSALGGLIAGRVVAIYSLRTDSLRRVRAVLQALAPTADIRTFSDAVGNDVLLAAARGAHLFAIVTGAAKHAATGFIEANRPKRALTVRCHSTGAAGLLRALEAAAMGAA